MKKIWLLVFLCILLLFVFLFFKVNAVIYIGDYSGNTRYIFDIKIKIDGKEVLNDSLTNSFPYRANFIVKEKLRYGLHKINIYYKL